MAKFSADDREYQRARTAYIPENMDVGWLDFFIEELDKIGLKVVQSKSILNKEEEDT